MQKACIMFALAVCMVILPQLAQGGSYGRQGPIRAERLNVQLTVKDDAGINRSAEPVTSGIPIPITLDLKTVQGLRIVDQKGAEVPAQFTVLARWNGTVADQKSPIQWVLLDFQADVEASRSTSYYLNYEAGHIAIEPSTPVSAQESNGVVTVTTGPMQFRVNPRSFNLFDGVWLDRNRDGRFSADEAIVAIGEDDGAFITDAFDARYGSSRGTRRVVVEENGPLRTVVLVEGRHHRTDENGLAIGYYDFQTRIHSYAGKSFVKVFHTLKNSPPCLAELDGLAGCPTPVFGSLAFKEYTLQTTLNLRQPMQHQLFAEELYESAGDSLSLYQDSSGNGQWQDYHGENWSYDIQVAHNQNPAQEVEGAPSFRGFVVANGQGQIGSGSRAEGWADMSDDRWGLTTQIRHFWQQFPKGISMEGTQLNLRLWPQDYQGVHWLDDGLHKTHELLYAFHLPDFNAADMVKSFNAPLLATAPTEWYSGARSIGPFGDLLRISREDFPPDLAPHYSHAGIGNKRTVYEGRDPYNAWGWIPFGDQKANPSAAGCPCIDPSTFSFFLQTKERDYFDTAEELARQWMDTRSYHRDLIPIEQVTEQPDLRPYRNGTHYQGWMPPDSYHAWFSPVYEYYLLTGNRKALEAADELMRFERHMGFWWFFTVDEQPYPIERAYGWLSYELTRMYEITGNISYLNDAEHLLKKGFNQIDKRRGNLLNAALYHPSLTGGTTYEGPRLRYDYGATSWQIGIALLGIGKYADVVLSNNIPRELMDGEEARDFLIAGADLLVHEIFQPNVPIFPEDWFLTNPQPSGSELYPYGPTNAIEYQITAGLSIAYRLTGKRAYYDAVNAMINKWGGKLEPYFQTGYAILAQSDGEAPLPVTDLRIDSGNTNGVVTLRWTAPRGGNGQGRATRYQLKYAETPIVERIDCASSMSNCYRSCRLDGYDTICPIEVAETNFWAATNAKGEPEPKEAGRLEEFTVKGLEPGKTYYFALKSEDDNHALSAMSNVVMASP